MVNVVSVSELCGPPHHLCREQEELKARLVEEDCAAVRDWARGEDPFASLRYVAGVDISFEKDQPDHACAMVVVMELPALEASAAAVAAAIESDGYDIYVHGVCCIAGGPRQQCQC